MDLGERIAGWRKHKDLTQRDVAKSLGITHAAISQWEDGTTKPTQENLAKLVGLFGLTMERFYGRVPPEKKAS